MSDDKNVFLINLLNSARSGDTQAYHQFLQDLVPIIQGFIFNKLGTGTDNEDILQEVLMAVHKSLHTFNTERSFTNWLFAIADYKIKDYLRVYYRNKTNMKVDIDKVDIEYLHTVTEALSSNELANELLEKLPENQKKIVYMMKIQGYSVKQVAELMNMSESAVKVSAHRAYNYLKNYTLERGKNE